MEPSEKSTRRAREAYIPTRSKDGWERRRNRRTENGRWLEGCYLKDWI